MKYEIMVARITASRLWYRGRCPLWYQVSPPAAALVSRASPALVASIAASRLWYRGLRRLW
jgi:hypothetical protein